ncbi:DNA-binding protein [Rhodococcus rhodnii]|uniref:Helix-turn-helix domain-containing protein n=2 Tax=Rhodococcus rhodnii TaxID=38312 RepID=R7WRS0_9NOCA|nr:hypothetical protein [Rhodococcus rhodnii]EOM78032.1 hypothetical protein Rrhod_0573 [Rhodococcus rhodnii LMG 5362]TXG90661.1 DNA-binding protein [Rhodococcus rhodnii]
MTPEELDALGVATDIQTAARALGISQSQAYSLARRDLFPVPVIRAGGRYVVPTRGLKAALGLES